MVKKVIPLIICIPLVLLGESVKTLKYNDVFKDMEKKDTLEEYNKNKRLKKIDKDSEELISQVEELIKKKRLVKAKKEEYNKNKIEELR